MKFSSAGAALLGAACVATAKTTVPVAKITVTSIPPNGARSVISELSQYIASVTTGTEYQALATATATAAPGGASGTAGNPGAAAEAVRSVAQVARATDVPGAASAIDPVVTGTPSWLGALPLPQQTFVRSVFAAEASIINKARSGTGRAAGGASGAVLAAGAVAAALVGGLMVL